MSIVTEALSELYVPAAKYVPGANALFFQLGEWEIVITGHGQERETLRRAEPDLYNLIERSVARLQQKINSITRSGEYLFFSQSLNRGIVCNVDFQAKQLRIVTVLDRGRSGAKQGTKLVIIEGVTYTVIELD